MYSEGYPGRRFFLIPRVDALGMGQYVASITSNSNEFVSA